jgi:branched-chain amino acid transport system ATP-binding protein
MDDLIEELHADHIKFSLVLDLHAEQLDRIHEGKSADYHLMLDAVSYIENYAEYSIVPKEDAIFKRSSEDDSFVELKGTIKLLRSDNYELKSLARKLHHYINAVLEDSIFEKENFERKLEACIQHQRDHMHMEEIIVFPLLRKRLSAEQIRKMGIDYKSKSSTLISNTISDKYNKLYDQMTASRSSSSRNIH